MTFGRISSLLWEQLICRGIIEPNEKVCAFFVAMFASQNDFVFAESFLDKPGSKRMPRLTSLGQQIATVCVCVCSISEEKSKKYCLASWNRNPSKLCERFFGDILVFTWFWLVAFFAHSQLNPILFVISLVLHPVLLFAIGNLALCRLKTHRFRLWAKMKWRWITVIRSGRRN